MRTVRVTLKVEIQVAPSKTSECLKDIENYLEDMTTLDGVLSVEVDEYECE
jgi:hypothetical protein